MWTWPINVSKAISWHFPTLTQRIGSAMWKVLFYEKGQAACGSERLVTTDTISGKTYSSMFMEQSIDSNHIRINFSISLKIKRAVTKLLEPSPFSPDFSIRKIPSTIELISSLTFSWKCKVAPKLFFLDFMVSSLIQLIKTELAWCQLRTLQNEKMHTCLREEKDG